MHFTQPFHFFAVMLCGWLVGTISLFCEGTVPFILKKVYCPQQPTRKRLFCPQFAKKTEESSIIIAIPTWPNACMYRGAGMLLARYRPLSAGKEKKAKEHLTFIFTFSFWICLNPVVGTGSDIRDWNQRKNFHFHIPNRFHIKPLLYKTLPTYNSNAPAIFTFDVKNSLS